MSEVIVFWLLLFVINSFYFIPRFILDFSRTEWVPVSGLLQGSWYRRARHLLIRLNYDVFRVCIDFFVLSCAYAFWLRAWIAPVPFGLALTVYFGISFLYQLYHTTFDKLYHLEPVLYNDALMLKNGLQIFVHEFDLRNFIITLTALAAAVLSTALILLMTSVGASAPFGSGSWIGAGIIGAASLFSILHYPYKKYPQLTFQSPLQALVRNLLMTRQVKHDIANLTVKRMVRYNIDPAVSLRIKPNVHLLVIESYGRIVMDHPALAGHYETRVIALERQLAEGGWHVCSQLSESPVTGGASWISYTSVMYGLNVKNQGIFRTMMKNPHIAAYDSLFHWLKRQGYTTYRLSSLGGYEKMEIPYSEYSRLYGIDHWILHKDLDYCGPLYGFGPSPPDQYALNFAIDRIRSEKGMPYALFFISQNSHTPYHTPEEVAEDWRTLNDAGASATNRSLFWSKPRFEDYGKAIAYQLDYCIDCILRQGTEQDLFVLVGDHQPASLSVPIDTFQTPVHLISKDPALIKAMQGYGFQQGLRARDDQVTRHEALYWALMRSLLATCAQPADRLPEFLEQGIPYA